MWRGEPAAEPVSGCGATGGSGSGTLDVGCSAAEGGAAAGSMDVGSAGCPAAGREIAAARGIDIDTLGNNPSFISVLMGYFGRL